MAVDGSSVQKVERINGLFARNLVTVTECAFCFFELAWESPECVPHCFPLLNERVAAHVEEQISRGPEAYYRSSFSGFATPASPPPVDRVQIDSSKPPKILCFRRGSDTPFIVEPDNPCRIAFEVLSEYLASQ